MKLLREAVVSALLVLSATAALAAITRCIAPGSYEPSPDPSISNAATICFVVAGALYWKFIGRLGSHRLFRTWCSWLPGTTASFGAVMAIIYYTLTATAFITHPILALGPFQLLQSQNISGFFTYYLLQIVPTPSDCVALPQYPLAFLACSAVVAYYIAVWVMLADRGFSFTLLRPTPTSTSASYTNAGQHAASAFRTTSTTRTPPAAPTTTPSTPKTPSTLPATHGSTTSLSVSTGSVLHSGLSLNRRVSNTPIFSGSKPSHASLPPVSSGSVLFSGLSINKRVSSTPIFTTDVPSPPATDAVGDSTLTQADADQTYRDGRNAPETIFEHKSSGDQNKNIPSDKIPDVDTEVAVGSDAAEPAGLAKLRRTSTFDPVNPVEIAAQAGVEDKDLIPAISSTLMRKSSSVKTSWDKLVSVKNKTAKKSQAMASYVKKKSLRRSTSKDAGPPLTPQSSLNPTPTPGAFSRRQSSLRRTASLVKEKLTPTACLGRGGVQD